MPHIFIKFTFNSLFNCITVPKPANMPLQTLYDLYIARSVSNRLNVLSLQYG